MISAMIGGRGGCRESRTSGAIPLVSILVVVYRSCEELERLITNLAQFRGPEVELLIVDGGSQDGTVEILKRRDTEIDFWLSEPDNGIYDAMNKGLAAAVGTYLLHINAGDRLLALPLEQLASMASRQVDVVCCQVLEDNTHLFRPRNDWLLRFDNTWHHQGTFYRRTQHLEYDSTYRVFGDFDHNQRLRKAGRKVALLDVTVATHKTDGASGAKQARHEVFRSIASNFGWAHVALAFLRFRLLTLRNLLSRGRRKSKNR